MKKALIKIGLICAISGLVLTACVKKEQAEKEQEKHETVETQPQTVTVEPVQQQPQTTTEYAMIENSHQDSASTHAAPTAEPAPVETAQVREEEPPVRKPAERTPDAPKPKYTQQAAPAQAASTKDETAAANEDDAVAAAMQAAKPAL